MNYLIEINAFENWLETNPIPDTAQLMWYKLMHTNNKCGWINWFDLANTTLMAKMNIYSNKTLNTARNILVDKGRIYYKTSGNRNKAGKYSLISFENSIAVVKNTIVKDIRRDIEQDIEQDIVSDIEPAILVKLNKTKKKENSSPIIFDKNSIEYKLALELKNNIHANDNRTKVPDEDGLQKWAIEFEKLLRIDNKTESDIKTVICFSQKDKFWKSNILSASKLREKFDTLFLQATNKPDNLKAVVTNRGNFEQRKYDDEYYNSLYKNGDKKD